MRQGLKVTLFLVLLFSLSCGGKSSYRYYNQPQAQLHESTHNVKELSGNVDMLWVVDNSGSMYTYQKSVADNLGAFIDTFSTETQIQWKMGLISTSVGENPYIGFKPGSELAFPDGHAAERFKKAIARLGTSGDSTERTYTPVIDVLKKYPNFIRPYADLAIILVSDAPEQSNMSTQEFVSALLNFKSRVSSISFYGVIDPSEWCPSTDDPFTWAGSKFQELLNSVKGAAYPICAKDYSHNLIDIAQKVMKNAISHKIYLESLPKLDTLKVFFHGAELPIGPKSMGGFWQYSINENAIFFHDIDFAKGDTESVTVKYEVDVNTP